MIINDSFDINEARSIDLGGGSTAYQYGDKYYIKKGTEKKEISSDQYDKLRKKSIDAGSSSNTKSSGSDYKSSDKVMKSVDDTRSKLDKKLSNLYDDFRYSDDFKGKKFTFDADNRKYTGKVDRSGKLSITDSDGKVISNEYKLTGNRRKLSDIISRKIYNDSLPRDERVMKLPDRDNYGISTFDSTVDDYLNKYSDKLENGNRKGRYIAVNSGGTISHYDITGILCTDDPKEASRYVNKHLSNWSNDNKDRGFYDNLRYDTFIVDTNTGELIDNQYKV